MKRFYRKSEFVLSTMHDVDCSTYLSVKRIWKVARPENEK
jgi:hypothetical protein